jgi:hypothetical protein
MTKNREDMNWYEERQWILDTFPYGAERLDKFESCKHECMGLCGESLDAGRAFTCLYLRELPEITLVGLQCNKWEKK